MASLSNKVALITGAAQGLGRSFSEALLKQGAKVCLADIDQELGEHTVSALQSTYGKKSCTFVECNVTKQKELEATFEKAKSEFKGLDIVCNNAGIMNESVWEKMLEINLMSVIRGTYLGLEHLSPSFGGRGGVIVNVASMAGMVAMPFGPVYTASKHGAVGFTRCIAMSPTFNKHQVRVNCLCPAFTDTNLLQISREMVTSMKEAKVAVQRIGVLELDVVVEGFMQLVQDQSLHGAVMRVTKEYGIDFKEFRDKLAKVQETIAGLFLGN